MQIVPSELNQRLADAIQNNVAADQFLIQGRTKFYRLIGLGLVSLGIGAAIGIGLFGYSYVRRNSTSMEALTSAFTKALTDVRLQGTAEGTVKIEPSEITLAKDQTVFLDPTSRLRLDPSAKVLADGELRVHAPTISTHQTVSSRTQSPSLKITNFTIFKNVPFEKGKVMTGWEFLTSAQKTPTSQYCYYTEGAEESGLDVVVYLARNQILDAPKTVPKDFDVKAAFGRCVWFRSSLL